MLCNLTNRNAKWRKLRVVGVFGNKAHVGNNVGDTELCGKIRAVAKVLNAHFAIFKRNETQGFLTFIEVPNRRTFPTAPECGDLNAVFSLIFFELCGIVIGPKVGLPGNELTVVKALFSENLELLRRTDNSRFGSARIPYYEN